MSSEAPFLSSHVSQGNTWREMGMVTLTQAEGMHYLTNDMSLKLQRE